MKSFCLAIIASIALLSCASLFTAPKVSMTHEQVQKDREIKIFRLKGSRCSFDYQCSYEDICNSNNKCRMHEGVCFKDSDCKIRGRCVFNTCS